MSKYELKYRVIKNETYKPFTNELKYTLVSVLYNKETDLIKQQGSKSWTRHELDLFSDKKQAEKRLCELNFNTHLGIQAKLPQYIDELEKNQNAKAVEALEEVRKPIKEKYDYLCELEEKGHLTKYGDGSKTAREDILNHIEQLLTKYGGKDGK